MGSRERLQEEPTEERERDLNKHREGMGTLVEGTVKKNIQKKKASIEIRNVNVNHSEAGKLKVGL